jgi:hypothetical protein
MGYRVLGYQSILDSNHEYPSTVLLPQQCPAKVSRMKRRDLHQILGVERQLQVRLVNIKQVFIGGGQDRNISESGFGKNDTSWNSLSGN